MRKRLIEYDLPLADISEASARVVAVESEDVARSSAKFLTRGRIADFRKWAESYYGDDADSQIGKIKQLNKPVITCCVSGMRSSVASRKLRKAGVKAINGGSWYSVKLIVDHEI